MLFKKDSELKLSIWAEQIFYNSIRMNPPINSITIKRPVVSWRGIPKKYRPKSNSIARKMLVKQGGKCFYCKGAFNLSTHKLKDKDRAASPTREHLERICEGGESLPENLVLAHTWCNGSRQNVPWRKWKQKFETGEVIAPIECNSPLPRNL